MGYEIKELDIKGFWTVIYNGKVDAAIRKAALKEGIEKARGKELKGILVDLYNADLNMSVTDSYIFAEDKFKADSLMGIKQAFLHKPNARNGDDFHVLVANNYGLLAKTFSDRDVALRWLLAVGDAAN